MSLDAGLKGRDTHKARGGDVYMTPPVAVEALLKNHPIPHRLWEPCCGSGNIVNVLRAAGHEVLASDLNDYGDPTHFYGRDFLMEHKAPDGCEAIITNPPFMLAHEFVQHALTLVPKVYMLLRLAFIESERRCDILDDGRLQCVYVFRKRLPMMHRKDWVGRKANSGMAFAWFCWNRNPWGRPTVIERISWER
jgi:hypothetical protein